MKNKLSSSPISPLLPGHGGFSAAVFSTSPNCDCKTLVITSSSNSMSKSSSSSSMLRWNSSAINMPRGLPDVEQNFGGCNDVDLFGDCNAVDMDGTGTNRSGVAFGCNGSKIGCALSSDRIGSSSR